MKYSYRLYEVLGYVIKAKNPKWIDVINHRYPIKIRYAVIDEMLRDLVNLGYVEANMDEQSIARRMVCPTLCGRLAYEEKRSYWLRRLLDFVIGGIVGALITSLLN